VKEVIFWLLLQKCDSSSWAHWKSSLLWILFTPWKLQSSLYLASWGKSTAGAIMPLPIMHKCCHGL